MSMGFDNLIDDLLTGAIISKLMVAHGVDTPTQIGYLVQKLQNELEPALGSDFQYMIFSVSDNSVHISFEQGYEYLWSTYGETIHCVLEENGINVGI